MFSIKNAILTEQIIKKSVFITNLCPVFSVDDANIFLKQIQKLHFEATHNCYSYIIGENQKEYKYSDDGEPSQTAGIVIYDVLKKNNLTNVICVVTRYYGGIKLGAGGLVRAYSSSAANGVKEAEIFEIIEYNDVTITTSYQYIDEIMKLLNEYENIEKSFLENVSLTYRIPTSTIEGIRENLINITKNNVKIEVS